MRPFLRCVGPVAVPATVAMPPRVCWRTSSSAWLPPLISCCACARRESGAGMNRSFIVSAHLPRASSAYVSIRQHTSAYVNIRQHTPACVSIRQIIHVSHTAIFVLILICVRILLCVSSYCYICVLILLYVSAYCYICVLIRMRTHIRPCRFAPQKSLNLYEGTYTVVSGHIKQHEDT